jgi:hypothetical protein
MIRGLVFAASAALVLGVAGCDEDTDSNGADGAGGSAATETTSTSLHTPACDLIAQAQLESMLGNPLSSPDDMFKGKETCQWNAPNFETDFGLGIQLSHNGAKDYDTARAMAEEKFGPAKDVSGIGDKGYFVTHTDGVGNLKSMAAQMAVTQGEDFVVVTVGGLTLDAAKGEELTETILRQVLLKID